MKSVYNYLNKLINFDGKIEENKINNNKNYVESIRIVYGSQNGTAKYYASLFSSLLSKYLSNIKINKLSIILSDISDIDPEDLNIESILIIFVSTYTNGTPPDCAKFFYDWLNSAVSDFRISKTYLNKLRFSIFGIGDSNYEEFYNTTAKKINGSLLTLGSHLLYKMYLGDVSSIGLDVNMNKWAESLFPEIKKSIFDRDYYGNYTNNTTEIKETEYVMHEQTINSNNLVDLEEIGNMMKKTKMSNVIQKSDKKKMLTPLIKKNLEKQGYRIIGDHSGVKICRWTKSMLRGRGGCYKHTFYGISSYQCMEMTPSLACANKCIFCWRHHTNPVGKEWKWVMNDPEFIMGEAIKNHKNMINQMKGIPGVTKERLMDAMVIRHCALSLVGEPIMYPKIDQLINLLHSKRISSFLVTNAQFPSQIQKIGKVTQLYVSVDASTKESLKAIDRPLFSDFWERFIDSLSELKRKNQRTVYRLTLVKNWNMNEIKNYCKIIRIGDPCFIEIKGVTFCGTSNNSNIRMENVPFHIEVQCFARRLINNLMGEYEIACEHAHSCCVLIAKSMFKVNGEWYTWIDYDKFMQLEKSGVEYGPLDYIKKTPIWALFGSSEEGFDPNEKRYIRKKKEVSQRYLNAKEDALRSVKDYEKGLMVE